jgi:hypothetical protein
MGVARIQVVNISFAGKYRSHASLQGRGLQFDHLIEESATVKTLPNILCHLVEE